MAAFAALAVHADVVPNVSIRAEGEERGEHLGAMAAVTCRAQLGAAEVAVAAATMLLALLSKESSSPVAVLVPFLALRAHEARGGVRRAPMIALAVSCTLVLALAWGYRALEMPFMSLGPERAMENPLLAVDGAHRLLGALDVLALYLRHIVTGAVLVPDYSFSEPPILRDGPLGIVLGGAFVLGCAAVVVKSWRALPRLADVIVALGASYLVVSNVVTPSSAIANRMVFFPSLWLVVLVAILVDRTARRPLARRAACAGVALFVLVQARAATAYAATWRDDATLYSDALRKLPNVYRTQRNLASELADTGRDADAAYHLVVAEAIYARYPTPVARDAVSPAWDGEPLPSRLAHVAASFGAPETCRASNVAARRLRSWEAPNAARLLDDWSKGACP
jgi:hypothetical protein